jgi:hypothetical protein
METRSLSRFLRFFFVSHIVAEHGAHIRVEDNRPVGARFTVEIPILAEPEPAENGAPAAARV